MPAPPLPTSTRARPQAAPVPGRTRHAEQLIGERRPARLPGETALEERGGPVLPRCQRDGGAVGQHDHDLLMHLGQRAEQGQLVGGQVYMRAAEPLPLCLLS